MMGFWAAPSSEGHQFVSAATARQYPRAGGAQETGLATWDLIASHESHFALQFRALAAAARAPADRAYWYSAIDLDPRRQAIKGFHVDENEYHMGLIRFDGTPKPACRRMQRLLAPDRSAFDSSQKRPN